MLYHRRRAGLLGRTNGSGKERHTHAGRPVNEPRRFSCAARGSKETDCLLVCCLSLWSARSLNARELCPVVGGEPELRLRRPEEIGERFSNCGPCVAALLKPDRHRFQGSVNGACASQGCHQEPSPKME